jgi:hypothetical protein
MVCDPKGSPCETSIRGAPHINEEGASHHLWLTTFKLLGLNSYQARNLLDSALAHICNEGADVTPDIEEDIYDATEKNMNYLRERKEPPSPLPKICQMRSTAFPPPSVGATIRLPLYQPYANGNVARLELVSPLSTNGSIDATSKCMLALPIGDRFAHFKVSITTPPRAAKLPFPLLPTRPTYERGLDYRMIETLDFKKVVLPTAREQARPSSNLLRAASP